MISGIYVQLQCSCSAVYLKAAKENINERCVHVLIRV